MLGGVVGLFTGMSMLSVMEMLFWLCRIMGSSCIPANRNGDYVNEEEVENNRGSSSTKVDMEVKGASGNSKSSRRKDSMKVIYLP